MRAEELDNLTEDELQKKANDCFVQAESLNALLQRNDSEKLRLLFEAQFYLTAVAKKRDDRISQRDFRLERIVIYLISIEIVLSFLFGFLGLYEGYQQSQVLDHMDKSSAATASAMKGASESLRSLADAQAASLDRLKEMNNKLQESLSQTSGMASSSRKQLEINQKEQADRLAQLAKKPRLALYIGTLLVPLNSSSKVTFPIREQTDTLIRFDFYLRNEGDAPAANTLLRAFVLRKNVGFASTIKSEALPVEEGEQQTFLMSLPALHPNATLPIVITFTFPKGDQPFNVFFNADADGIETGTPLGGITITPRKPLN
jgi:hypothetical protein